MHKSLRFLLGAKLRGWLMFHLSKMTEPRRWVAVASVLLPVYLIYTLYRNSGFVEKLSNPGMLVFFASILLASSFVQGLLKPGLRHEAAEVPHLFCGPYSTGQILFYHTVPMYPQAAATSLAFYWVFGRNMPGAAGWTLCAALFQVLCSQTTFLVSLGSKPAVEGRSRLVRFAAWSVVLLYVAGFICAATSTVFSVGFVRELFYTSWENFAASVPWPFVLLALVTGVALTLWLLRGLSVNLGEVSTHANESVPASVCAPGRPTVVSSSRGLGSFRVMLFHGAGAMAWKALVCARRSKKKIVVAACLTMVVSLPWVIVNAAGLGASYLSEIIPIFIALLPLLGIRFVDFDFRRETARLDHLQLFPFEPLPFVLSVLIAPTMICLVLQLLATCTLLAGFSYGGSVLQMLYSVSQENAGRIAPETAAFLFMLCPATTFAIVGSYNLQHLLFFSHRQSQQGVADESPLTGVLGLVFSLLVLLPAAVAFRMVSPAAALVVQYLIDLLLLWGMVSTIRNLFGARAYQNVG